MAVELLVLEGGDDGAARFVLAMLIIGIAAVELDRLQQALAQFENISGQHLGLVHVDIGGVAGDAVLRIILLNRRADMAGLVGSEKIRSADRLSIAVEE